MEKLRVGLIGCGIMMKNHVRGMEYVETVEIVAVCDIIEERAKVVAEALGNNPEVYTDYHDMVDKIDAVLIALPHQLHYECGMFFAFHNKHILMEKTLVNCEEEGQRLIKLCEERGLVFMCAYPVRYWQGIKKLKELVDSGEYGEIIQMSIWTEQLTGLSGYEEFQRSGRVDWLDNRAGGGQFFCHGCHYIDLLLWFLGEPVSGSHIGTRNGTPWMLFEGSSAVIMKFKNGAIGYHGATWGARGTKNSYDFQIQTEKGLLNYDHFEGEIRLYNKSLPHEPGVAETKIYEVLWTRGNDRSKETQHEMRHFAECVRTGKTPETDAKQAMQSLRCIWKLYDAEKHGVVADLTGLGFDNV